MKKAIITALETTQPLVSVVVYGCKTKPKPPYAVIRQGTDPLGRGTQFRIIVHFLKGQQNMLEEYVRKTISDVLTNFQATDISGNLNQLHEDYNILPELTVDESDDTIVMERVYYMPDILF